MENQRNEVKVVIGNVTTSFAVLGTSVKECLEEAIRMELAPKITYINNEIDVNEISRKLAEQLYKRGITRA